MEERFDVPVTEWLDEAFHRCRAYLEKDDPATRVEAMRDLSTWVVAIERLLIQDANRHGLPWATIGEIYGTSRQAAHQRFANETTLPAEFFDQLLDDDEDDEEAGEAFRRAQARAAEILKNPPSVRARAI